MSESVNPPNGEQHTVRSQRPPYAIAAVVLVITVVTVAVAVLLSPSEFRVPLAIGAGIAALLLTGAITAAVYYRDQVRAVRQEAHAYTAQADARVAATISAAQARITESEARIHSIGEHAAEQARAAKENEHRRAAALAAFAGAAGRMQAMSTSMLAELREMEHRHADPKVLSDLLELDHRTAQAGRLADSIAVLSGARSGRRWAKPIAMESILRGAMGRVAGYQRVRLRAVTEIAVAGHAAEGVMHALAELLDNACNFSPPTTEVHVYAAEVPAGVVITIEDSGLVMSESALRRAESAVAGPRADTDLSSLSGTRLGLAVVGHLARKHDLTVSYRPSAIGGTAVVVVIPRELTTRLERQSGTLSRLTPVDAAEPAAPQPSRTPVRPIEPARADTAPAPARGREPATTAHHDSHTSPQAQSSERFTTAPPAGSTVAAQARGSERSTTAPGDPIAPAQARGSDNLATDATAARADGFERFTQPPAAPAHESPTGSRPAAGGVPSDEFAGQAATSSGLPKRQRGSTLAAVHPEGLAAPADPPPPRPPAAPSAMGAFQRAVSGRETPTGPASSPLTNLDPPASESVGGRVPTVSTRQDPLGLGAEGDASLLPRSLMDAVRRGIDIREKAGATTYSAAPPAEAPDVATGRDHGAGAPPAPANPWETDR
ncbi:sensor histidine kinase [Nocardia tengchongensis]|uniref:sensor histidine kinase n=1 Tax=Nocardia tengchongensis TaxID=2055889 RepID=UPI0036A2AE7C